MKSVKTDLITPFITNVRNKKLPDKNFEVDATVFKILLDLTKIKVHRFYVDMKRSSLQFNGTSQTLDMQLADLTYNLDFSFNLASNPAFIKDTGDGVINLNKIVIDIKFGMKEVDGYPVFFC